MTSLKRLAPLGAVLALCLLAAPGLAETTAEQAAAAKTEKAAKPKKGAVPKEVNIEADQMEILDEKKQAVFKGNVDAKRADVHLTCDDTGRHLCRDHRPDHEGKEERRHLPRRDRQCEDRYRQADGDRQLGQDGRQGQ